MTRVTSTNNSAHSLVSDEGAYVQLKRGRHPLLPNVHNPSHRTAKVLEINEIGFAKLSRPIAGYSYWKVEDLEIIAR